MLSYAFSSTDGGVLFISVESRAGGGTWKRLPGGAAAVGTDPGAAPGPREGFVVGLGPGMSMAWAPVLGARGGKRGVIKHLRGIACRT